MATVSSQLLGCQTLGHQNLDRQNLGHQRMPQSGEHANPHARLEAQKAQPYPEMRRVQESWVAAVEMQGLPSPGGRTPGVARPGHLDLTGLQARQCGWVTDR